MYPDEYNDPGFERGHIDHRITRKVIDRDRTFEYLNKYWAGLPKEFFDWIRFGKRFSSHTLKAIAGFTEYWTMEAK